MSIKGNMEQKQIKGKVSELVKVDRSLSKEGYAADSKTTGDALEARVKKVEIADNLTTDNPYKVLSARQGVELEKHIGDSASEIRQELDFERTRINALSTLEEGSTTGDAELIDARIDYTGKTWGNVGEHIRGVSGQLSSEIEEMDNGFIKSQIVFEQGVYNASGTIAEQPNAIRTAFEAETQESKLKLINKQGHGWLLIGNNKSPDATSGWVIIKGSVPFKCTSVNNFYEDTSKSFSGYKYYRLTERVAIDENSLMAITPNNRTLQVFTDSNFEKRMSKIEKNDLLYLLHDKVGGMMNVAESHFNVAFAEGTNLVYQNKRGSGLFYPTPFYVYKEVGDDESLVGKPVTNCSQFISTLVKGLYYENSRYVNGVDGENEYSTWAWFTDGTGMYNDPNYDAMSASGWAKYADTHGWLRTMDSDRCNLQNGDFVFFVDEGAEVSIENVGHVAMVAHVGKGSKTVQVIESWGNTKSDGNKSGLREYVYDYSEIAYYASFPIPSSLYRTEKIFSNDLDLVSEAGTRSTNVLTRVSDKFNASMGMYTFVIDGEFDKEKMPYVSYQTASGTYIKNYFVRCGNSYIRTVHLPYDVGIININYSKEYGCELRKLAVYKGYIDLDSRFL